MMITEKKISLLTALLLVAVPIAVATPALADCFQEEGFSSQAEFLAAQQDWMSRKPERPGWIELVRALLVLKKVEAQAKQLFTPAQDKSRHCYVGCRLAQKIDFRTAVYAGWEKERRDLNDCNRSTDFELKDYQATAYGAAIGRDQSQPESCATECVTPQI